MHNKTLFDALLYRCCLEGVQSHMLYDWGDQRDEVGDCSVS